MEYFIDQEDSVCDNCNSDNTTISNGNIVCMLCGITIKRVVSESAEWSNHLDSSGNSSNNSRCGSIINSTEINPFINDLVSFTPKGTKNIFIKDGKIIKYDICKIHIKNSQNYLTAFVTTAEIR